MSIIVSYDTFPTCILGFINLFIDWDYLGLSNFLTNDPANDGLNVMLSCHIYSNWCQIPVILVLNTSQVLYFYIIWPGNPCCSLVKRSISARQNANWNKVSYWLYLNTTYQIDNKCHYSPYIITSLQMIYALTSKVHGINSPLSGSLTLFSMSILQRQIYGKRLCQLLTVGSLQWRKISILVDPKHISVIS